MSDRYDAMSNDELERIMRIRGMADKIQWFPGPHAKADYLRDWDYDSEQIERGEVS